MISLVIGSIPLLQKRAFLKLTQTHPQAEIEYFHGAGIEMAALLESAASLSLFSAERFVVIREADQLSQAAKELMLAHLESLIDSVHWILLADKVDRRLKFWQVLEKRAQILSAEAPALGQLRNWIEQEWWQRGRKITPQAVEALLLPAKEEFNELCQALERIDLFLPAEAKVDLTAVDECLGSFLPAKVFALTDAIGEQNWSQAALLLDRLIRHEVGLGGLLAMIVRQIRILLKARTLMQQGTQKAQFASALGVPPYFVEKYLAQAKKYSLPALQEMWRELVRTDRELKSTPMKRRWVLELLLSRLRAQSVHAAA